MAQINYLGGGALNRQAAAKWAFVAIRVRVDQLASTLVVMYL